MKARTADRLSHLALILLACSVTSCGMSVDPLNPCIGNAWTIRGFDAARLENASASPLVGVVHSGERVRLDLAFESGCTGYASVGWISSNPAVAQLEVAPTSDPHGQTTATLVGRASGDATITAVVTEQNPVGNTDRSTTARLVYYCCGGTCPAVPATCQRIPIERVKVAP
jgi:hypothetical protein